MDEPTAQPQPELSSDLSEFPVRSDLSGQPASVPQPANTEQSSQLSPASPDGLQSGQPDSSAPSASVDSTGTALTSEPPVSADNGSTVANESGLGQGTGAAIQGTSGTSPDGASGTTGTSGASSTPQEAVHSTQNIPPQNRSSFWRRLRPIHYIAAAALVTAALAGALLARSPQRALAPTFVPVATPTASASATPVFATPTVLPTVFFRHSVSGQATFSAR